jgi:hypothetical protein
MTSTGSIPSDDDGNVARTTVHRLTGVYNADGSVRGELSYWIGARLGRAHCALCDVTHGVLREKREWRVCRAKLPVTFRTVHLDEQDADLAAFTRARTPCVVAETSGGLEFLLGPVDLDACGGSPDSLVTRILEVAAERGLSFVAEEGRPS